MHTSCIANGVRIIFQFGQGHKVNALTIFVGRSSISRTSITSQISFSSVLYFLVVNVVANIDCRLDRLQTHYGDKPLLMSIAIIYIMLIGAGDPPYV